jgi:predicted metalloprotease with PDZ domain
MSITEKRFLLLAVFCLEIVFLTVTNLAQDFEAKITLAPGASTTVQIEGKILRQKIAGSNKSWSFMRSFPGVENLGERIESLNLSNAKGERVAFRSLVPGEYLAEEQAENYLYQANLKTPNPAAMAHVSWIRDEQGILMLGDLLPQFTAANNQPISAKITFQLPVDWKIISREKKSGNGEFFVSDVEKAIFLIGKNWREKEISVDKNNLNFAISGEWKFSDDEAFQMAGEIFAEYKKQLGDIPFENARINLIHFPSEISFDRWEAETRGANVTILSSDMPFKTLSLQRLHEQLRHEIFHLWLPNSLALTGNYAWFYEGFTVYQSLRTALEMNQIRFEDFLRTLEQAQFIDSRRIQRTSLIEASKNRWNDSSSTVYARGMLIAFLCDLALLKNSKGKRSVADLFRQILKLYPISNKAVDGNTSVLSVLDGYAELRPIVEKYVSAAEKINWQTELESTGIESRESGSVLKLQVKTKLQNQEKNLLEKLGYNNWRKSLGKSK